LKKKIKLQIKKISVKVGNNKILIQNFSYLSALRIFSLLIPLITYPYLIRVVGKETFGLVVFAQAIIQYLVILVDFGFNISATKEVSIHRDNNEKLSEIVSSVLTIKGGFFLISVIILSILVLFIPQAKGHEPLFYLSMWACLYNLIFPMWYFQGIEKMKYITYITLISRLTFLGLIFVFINSPNDYLYIPIINGIGALLAGIASFYIIFAKNGIKPIIPSQNNLKFYFKESVPLFVSNISTTLYLSTNKVILGALIGMDEVAYYDIAEKITTILKTPIQIIGQTIYPRIAKTKDLLFIRKALLFTLLLAALIFMFGISFSRTLIATIGGKTMFESTLVLQILLSGIFPISISLIFANIMLISWGYNKSYLKMKLLANLLYIIIITSLYLSGLIGLISLAITAVVIEFFVAFLSIFICRRKNILMGKIKK